MSPAGEGTPWLRAGRESPQSAMERRGKYGPLFPLGVLRSHIHLSGPVHPLSSPVPQHPDQSCLFANISEAVDSVSCSLLFPQAHYSRLSNVDVPPAT